ESNPAGGIYVRHHFSPNFALRGQVFIGKISGDDRNFTEPAWRQQRAYSFISSLSEAGLQLEWDILGKRRFRRHKTVTYQNQNYQQLAVVNQVGRTLSPYLFAGGGVVTASAKPDFTGGGALDDEALKKTNIDLENSRKVAAKPMVLFGGGLHYDLSAHWVMGLELGLRYAFSDYLDGISISGNPDMKDWYTFAALQVGYRFGNKDRDGDGVADAKDACPDHPGLSATEGCPDADKDGIADPKDRCPFEAGTSDLAGCPNKDSDKDGIVDSEDQCPTEPGTTQFKGCPDSDGDGIRDRDDACPLQFGTRELNGCPLKDRDRDGVADDADACPDDAGSARTQGCPDADDDGIPDRDDLCPATAGMLINRGCPVVEEKDKKVLALAVKQVQFEFSNATLLPQSEKILDDIADIMTKYPDYHLTIEGYTDNVGSTVANQYLSEQRANACLAYLSKKGVPAARMKAFGMGENLPVGDNGTPEGRAKNRRVEFELGLPKK
ncbi:MAG TPA: DUF6089 family protein, partial [Saprospiraceae bacterium]|nr:DUF6089 family protein [Saprospiraceae bacterium]